MYVKVTAAMSPYTLVPPSDIEQTPIQNIYIETDSSAGAITINLPAVASFNFPGASIFVHDKAGSAAAHNVTIAHAAGDTPDTINGSASSAVMSANKSTVKLEMTNGGSGSGNWLATGQFTQA